MIDKKASLTKDEFITFVMIYASEQDYDFSTSEEEAIKARYGLSTFQKVYDLYVTLGEFERLRLIMSYKSQYFNSIQKTGELLLLIKEQFYSDGDYSRSEKSSYNFLEHVLNEQWA